MVNRGILNALADLAFLTYPQQPVGKFFLCYSSAVVDRFGVREGQRNSPVGPLNLLGIIRDLPLGFDRNSIER